MPDLGSYIEVGTKVAHSVYGEGEVIATEKPISELYCRVEFNGHSMSVPHEQLTIREEDLT